VCKKTKSGRSRKWNKVVISSLLEWSNNYINIRTTIVLLIDSVHTKNKNKKNTKIYWWGRVEVVDWIEGFESCLPLGFVPIVTVPFYGRLRERSFVLFGKARLKVTMQKVKKQQRTILKYKQGLAPVLEKHINLLRRWLLTTALQARVQPHEPFVRITVNEQPGQRARVV
jgi:hypothetical protein